jgi:hypothetical protein
MCDLRMHCTEDINDHQSMDARAGVKMYAVAVGGSSDAVKCDSTVDRGIDAYSRGFNHLV